MSDEQTIPCPVCRQGRVPVGWYCDECGAQQRSPAGWAGRSPAGWAAGHSVLTALSLVLGAFSLLAFGLALVWGGAELRWLLVANNLAILGLGCFVGARYQQEDRACRV